MKKKEFKVGEVFQCGLIKLKVEKQNKGLECQNCFFESFCHFGLEQIVGGCDYVNRSDRKNVIFVEVEEQINNIINLNIL